MTHPTTQKSDGDVTGLREALIAKVGSNHVSTEPSELRLYSRDVSVAADNAPFVATIARPANTAEVAACAKAAADHGVAVSTRGGGVSYTAGYVPSRAGTLLLDLARLNVVHEINTRDLYVVADAGVTWQQLATALKPHGLRASVKGPISGTHATIGGLAAQSSASTAMSGYLGLEVVLADGTVVRTGSGALRQSSFFYRNYGPDLTGLFLGDAGTYGIKTVCALSLERIPGGAAFASIAFESLGQMTEAIEIISRSGVHCRILGMDPLKNQTATKVDLVEGIRTMWRVVRGARNPISGLAQGLRIAINRNALTRVAWSLHLTIEDYDQEAADAALRKLRKIGFGVGREIEPIIPTALYARPYSIRGIVGISGERWVPIHGVFPFTRVPEVVRRTEQFFSERSERLVRHNIAHSFLVVSDGRFLILEPMFYWRDELSPLHARVLGSKYERFKDIPADHEARAAVSQFRRELAELFDELGAVHSQLGKFYAFESAINPATYALLTRIKDMLDPGRRLNSGNLGWQ